MHLGCDEDHHSLQEDNGLRMCSMSLCHPGIAVEPAAMPCSAHRYAHDAGHLPEGVGVLPEIELPPPRSLV
jgi:hypothetical protein